jgi:EmrB/QacA subfamily drug resistance transporter
MWAGISGAGTALGPVLSGFLLEHYSWASVFALNIPFIAVAVVMVWKLVPRSRNAHEAPIDIRGALLSIIGVSTLVYAIIEAPGHGWLATETLVVAAIGVIALAAFVWWELRAENPMLDVRLFKIPAFGVSSLVLTLVFFTLMGIFFSVSQLLQLVYGYSPLAASVRMLPVSVMLVVVAPQSPKLVERYGKRTVVAAGMVFMAAGLAVLSRMDAGSSYALLLVGLVLMAGGIAAAMSPTTDLLMSAVPREHAGMGSAMNDTTRELGGSLGVAVFGSLLASRYVDELAPSLGGLADSARTTAQDSLGGALGVAARAGGSDGAGLAAAARDAWMGGFSLSLMIGTVIIAAAAVLAYKGLPDSAADEEVTSLELDDSFQHASA